LACSTRLSYAGPSIWPRNGECCTGCACSVGLQNLVTPAARCQAGSTISLSSGVRWTSLAASSGAWYFSRSTGDRHASAAIWRCCLERWARSAGAICLGDLAGRTAGWGTLFAVPVWLCECWARRTSSIRSQVLSSGALFIVTGPSTSSWISIERASDAPTIGLKDFSSCANWCYARLLELVVSLVVATSSTACIFVDEATGARCC